MGETISRVAVAQLEAVPGEPERNWDRLADCATTAAGKGAEVLVFPELFDTGYDLARVRDCAGTWADGRLDQLADAQGLSLVGGLSEVVGERVYNALQVVEPGRGRTACYRKRHLVGILGEPEVLDAGDALLCHDLHGLRWGFLICYDLRFPEQARDLALAHGAEVLCVVSAWPFPRLGHWQTLLQARAIENQCYLLAANRVGSEGGSTFCGASAVIDPHGVTVCEAPSEGECLLDAELLPDHLRQIRTRYPFLGDSRMGPR